MIDAVRKITTSIPMARHIFNLGHGISQHTDPNRVATLITTIRQCDERTSFVKTPELEVV